MMLKFQKTFYILLLSLSCFLLCSCCKNECLQHYVTPHEILKAFVRKYACIINLSAFFLNDKCLSFLTISHISNKKDFKLKCLK